jgi:hypothetical protein
MEGEVVDDIAEADVIVLVHPEETTAEELGKHQVIFDPWRKFTSDTNKVVHYGNTRMQ